MGTSSSYGGPGGGTPLVPTWLEPNGLLQPGPDGVSNPGDGAPGAPNPIPQNNQPIIPNPRRFTSPRSNFSRFVSSGGRDRASLGRAVSRYVSSSSGGARQAARRMGSSRTAGGRILGFLSNVATRGAIEALRILNLERLVGQPIETIFLGIADYVCPDGGTLDEGIAREAFIETIAELADNGITDLDTLNPEQMQTVFELYATYSIEARLCNDIGMKLIVLPLDVRTAEQVQTQLRDFIRRGVADALTRAQAALQSLTTDNVQRFVDRVYEQAFSILQTLGEEAAAA